MDLGLKGRVAVITGGSKGIGRTIAFGLAAEGVAVVLLARDQARLDKTAAEIGKKSGVRALGLSADVTNAAAVAEAAATIKAQFDTVHVLVNNAGTGIRRLDRQITWPDREWMEDINLKTLGMLRVTQAFLPSLARDGSGRIINVSGIAGTSVMAPALTHGINNAAMNQATAYLAQDLARDRITVNAVVPGLVGTEWREGWAQNMADQQGKTKDAFLDEFCKKMGILEGRWASMQEVADVVLFLASDRSRYINGARIPVDGGYGVNARP